MSARLSMQVEEAVFLFKIVEADKPETKRGIFPTVASLYDPLSLLAKTLLQKLWQRKAERDEQLPERRQWKNDLSYKVKISRCYKSND